MKRACALTASGSISKAVHGLVGGVAKGSAECRKNWTTALIPRSSGSGTHPTSAECAEAGWNAGRNKTGIASLPHVKLAPMSALGPTGERQEHLGAIISFAVAGQRKVCVCVFRGILRLSEQSAIYLRSADSSSTRSSHS